MRTSYNYGPHSPGNYERVICRVIACSLPPADLPQVIWLPSNLHPRKTLLLLLGSRPSCSPGKGSDGWSCLCGCGTWAVSTLLYSPVTVWELVGEAPQEPWRCVGLSITLTTSFAFHLRAAPPMQDDRWLTRKNSGSRQARNWREMVATRFCRILVGSVWDRDLKLVRWIHFSGVSFIQCFPCPSNNDINVRRQNRKCRFDDFRYKFSALLFAFSSCWTI